MTSRIVRPTMIPDQRANSGLSPTIRALKPRRVRLIRMITTTTASSARMKLALSCERSTNWGSWACSATVFDMALAIPGTKNGPLWTM